MTPSVAPVEQAVVSITGSDIQVHGASAGLDANRDWRENAERLVRSLGMPSSFVEFSHAVMAQPFGSTQVVIAQFNSALTARLLILPRATYYDFIRDPFLIDARFAPDWSRFGLLPTLEWKLEAPPRRTTDALQKVLQHGGSQTLLGAVQALVDGGRVVFERPTPAPKLIEDLWSLLPDSVRGELWPATFAFSNDLRFDLLVVPSTAGMDLDRYVTEERAVDYPEGRYEFALQYAIEHGDQGELDRLLSRRSGRQVLRLAVLILALMTLGYVGINLLLTLLHVN